MAWNDTDFFTAVDLDKRLREKHVFFGEEEFANTTQLLRPFIGIRFKGFFTATLAT
jgi:hypothetical protein